MRSSCRLATLLFSPLLLWLPASVAADGLTKLTPSEATTNTADERASGRRPGVRRAA